MDELRNYFSTVDALASQITFDREMLSSCSESRVEYLQSALAKDEKTLEEYVNGGFVE